MTPGIAQKSFRIASLLIVMLASHPLAAKLSPQETTEVLKVRLGVTPGRTRVVFDLSEPSAPTLMTLDNPARVVVDIPVSTTDFDHRKLPLLGTPIARIRAGTQADASLRYVFDVSGELKSRLFPLQPNEQHGHRLVLDLYSQNGKYADTTEKAATGLQLAATENPNRERSLPSPQSATAVPNPVSSGSSGEWSGSISLQTRLFFENPRYPQQDEQNASAAFEPEYYIDWARGSQRFAFRPFFRYDANDDERTHGDIRELYWRLDHEQWVVKAGMDVVFWGVTESKHLVDIINQTDWVENIDGEDKLGQPMLNIDYMTDGWGTWQAYVLPYFRERTFPGEDGRLRTAPPVDTDDPVYESGDEEEHIDFALRWSHYIGDLDFGFAHFSGTSRDPVIIPSSEKGEPRLLPYYLQIDQSSLDIQATKGAWLWKLEAIYNDNKLEDYFAASGGFEYTYFGLSDGPADLGWLLEYHFDERDEDSQSPLQNDIYAGLRYSGNDIAGTRILAGFTVDADSGSTFGNIEAVRRLGESWTATVELRLFTNTDEDDDPLHIIRDDDYIELQLSRYF